jgi:hypothetical protein
MCRSLPNRSATLRLSSRSSRSPRTSPAYRYAVPRLLYETAVRWEPIASPISMLRSRSAMPAWSPRWKRAEPTVFKTSARSASRPNRSTGASASFPVRIAYSYSAAIICWRAIRASTRARAGDSSSPTNARARSRCSKAGSRWPRSHQTSVRRHVLRRHARDARPSVARAKRPRAPAQPARRPRGGAICRAGSAARGDPGRPAATARAPGNRAGRRWKRVETERAVSGVTGRRASLGDERLVLRVAGGACELESGQVVVGEHLGVVLGAAE